MCGGVSCGGRIGGGPAVNERPTSSLGRLTALVSGERGLGARRVVWAARGATVRLAGWTEGGLAAWTRPARRGPRGAKQGAMRCRLPHPARSESARGTAAQPRWARTARGAGRWVAARWSLGSCGARPAAAAVQMVCVRCGFGRVWGCGASCVGFVSSVSQVVGRPPGPIRI